MTQYRFRQGARVAGVKPERAVSELARISDDHDGRLNPTDVVEAARPKVAPLHPAFEWSDSKAAEQYRLIQARQLIRAVIVVSDDVDEAPRPIYVHVERDNYQPVDVVVREADLYELALSELQAKFSSAERALRELREAAKEVPQRDKLAAINIVTEGFATIREALAVLKAA